MKLDDLGVKYKTDKSSIYHDYLSFYEEHLPEKVDRLLEIGVMDGASLKMWRDYYPQAEIIGLDIKEPREIEGVSWLKMDATDVYAMKGLGKFDVIVDDGSHMTLDQQITFHYAYKNMLNPGGIYIMEDLHTSFNENYINSKYTTFEALYMHELTGVRGQVKLFSRSLDRTDSFTAVIKK
jgi:spermidine synthase